MDKSIESLFGSKTRIKLLNLFLANPEKSYYVREITRLIDEQVNSVRRELKNLEESKVVKSTSEERKVFYGINQRFKYYIPLRAIFAGTEISENIRKENSPEFVDKWQERVSRIEDKVDVLVVSGVFVADSESNVDMLLVGDNRGGKLSAWASDIESQEGRELNYAILANEDFYYRYTTKDTFVSQIFSNSHHVVIDKEEIIKL